MFVHGESEPMTDDVDFRQLAKEKYGDKITQLQEEQVERLEELFHEKMDKFGNERLALTSAIGSFNFEESAGGQEELIYTVGVDGPRKFSGQTLFCYGVLDPEGEDSTPGRVAIVVPCSDVENPDQVKEWFSEPFNALTGNISTSPAKGVRGAYTAEIGSMGDVFSVAEDDPRDFEERREFVMDHVEESKIAEISNGMSELKDSGYAQAFGADFKVISYATILEAAVSDKASRYVFQDDSFIEARDLPPEVRGEDDELGLVGFGDPDVMALDTESIVDVFGTITPSSEGQPRIDIFGYYGHHTNEKEVNTSSGSSDTGGSDGSSSSSATGEAVEERTI